MSELLPTGWRMVSTADLFEYVTSGSRGWAQYYADSGAKYIRVGNLERGSIALDLRDIQFVRPPPAGEGTRTSLQPHDILISITADVGMVAVVPDDLGEAYVNQHVALARPRLGLNSPYIAMFLASSAKDQFGNLQRGVTKVGLGLDDIRSVQVALPPLAEQRRIVDKIDALFAHSKKAKESLDRIPALLEKLKRSILAAAFRGDLTKDWREAHPDVEPADALLARIRAERRRRWEEAELARLTSRGNTPTDDRWKSRYESPIDIGFQPTDMPGSWSLASLDELASAVDYGTSAKTDDDDRGVPVLRMGNIQNGEIDYSDLRYLPSTHEEFPSLLLTPGDLLFNRTNSPELVGKTAVYDGSVSPCSAASYLLRVRLLQVPPRLVAYYINSPVGRSWIRQEASQQVGQANVSGTKLRALGVPVPPLAEQVEIARLIDIYFEAIRGANARLEAMRRRCDDADAAILSKAFRGELVPQDPNDEPASVLLDRIRAAREAASTEPDEAKPKRPRARRAVASDDTSAPAASTSTMPAEAAASSTEATSAPAADAPRPFQPTLFPTTASPFLDLPRPAQLPLVHDALRGLGALTTDDAIRRVADHLRTHGHAEFMRLRSDGPLYAALDKALDAAVREGLVDRPRRGHVRALVPDAKHYTDADWARCLEAARAEHASSGAPPLDDDALIRAAADWAVENMGLKHQRLRTGGTVHQGLTRALAASKPSG